MSRMVLFFILCATKSDLIGEVFIRTCGVGFSFFLSHRTHNWSKCNISLVLFMYTLAMWKRFSVCIIHIVELTTYLDRIIEKKIVYSIFLSVYLLKWNQTLDSEKKIRVKHFFALVYRLMETVLKLSTARTLHFALPRIQRLLLESICSVISIYFRPFMNYVFSFSVYLTIGRARLYGSSQHAYLENCLFCSHHIFKAREKRADCNNKKRRGQS